MVPSLLLRNFSSLGYQGLQSSSSFSKSFFFAIVILFATAPYKISSLLSFKSLRDILVTVKETASLLPLASLIASQSTGKAVFSKLLFMLSTGESGNPTNFASVLPISDNVIGIDEFIICSESD